MRSMMRALTVSAAVLSLAVVSVPAAHARPLDERAPAVRHDTSWFEAALSFVTALLPGGHGALQQMMAADGTTGTGTLAGGAHPNTGSCIDPQGGGIRCGGGF
jgi:hypothetical protein